MIDTVQGGPVFDTAMSLINRIFNSLINIDTELKDAGLNKREEKDIEEDGINGKYLVYETGGDADDNPHLIEVELFGVEQHPGKFVLRMSHDGKKDLEETDKVIDSSEVSNRVVQYSEKYDPGALDSGRAEGVDMGDDALFENSHISITLHRVQGSTSPVKLTAINAHTDPHNALLIVEDLLSDDEFVKSIGEDPQSFAVTQEDDHYDVNEIDSVDTHDTFDKLLQAACECYHNLQCIHWGAKSNDFATIHSTIESLVYQVAGHIDTIAEWCIEYSGHVPNLLNYSYSAIACDSGFDLESGFSAAKQLLNNYVAALECYYVNAEHDVQSVLDNWIRDLNKQNDYILSRTLLND